MGRADLFTTSNDLIAYLWQIERVLKYSFLFSEVKSEIVIGQVPQTKSAVGDIFNIMSEGYRQNRFNDAKYARCDIVVNGEKYNAPQTIEMTVY